MERLGDQNEPVVLKEEGVRVLPTPTQGPRLLADTPGPQLQGLPHPVRPNRNLLPGWPWPTP